MGMTLPAINAISIQDADFRPQAVTQVHKQVWDGEEFQPRTYYRVPLARGEREAAERWLEPQFGAANPRGTWWCVGNNVFMERAVYTWWCLAHGVQEEL